MSDALGHQETLEKYSKNKLHFCLEFLFPIVFLAKLDTPKAWILISIPCTKLWYY